ncbi:unnamed protein product, partial [Mesorhabditis spiculigera]
MVKWARAQLLYSDMLHRVGPLRNELSRLQAEVAKKEKQGEEIKARIGQLEQSIAAYKDEYAQLIGQAENIKADLSTVQEKVERSQQLLSSLGSERNRCTGSSDSFSQQMGTLVGDAMLSAAFLAYAGYFDQLLRDHLFYKWVDHAQKAGIKFRADLARIEYLSTMDDRMAWNRNGLLVDDLCSENAIMLHRFNRYPLVIDPSGQAIDFIMKQFEAKKIQKTSFLDTAFRKQLESALRFGNALLVQDVESYDPILNPVLNREIRRAGGRILITIGDQEIILSPSFEIFLFTRDSSAEFPPDICSRVTFVNFTVTSSSLSSHCLNQVLRSERPDVDKKRSDLLKLQGEFAARLRQLEKALLSALNESKGKILDDDSVIGTLEKLRTEANEVQKKAAETDQVMAEVDTVSSQYSPLAAACSQIYHALQQLGEVHFLYQYSLDFLIGIFTNTLATEDLSGVSDYKQRLDIITRAFKTVYGRVSQGMLHADKSVLALLLLRIYVKGSANTYDVQWNHLLGRGENTISTVDEGKKYSELTFLTAGQRTALAKLAKVPGFTQAPTSVSSKANEVAKWLVEEQSENNVPVLWNESDNKLSDMGAALYRTIVIHTLRADRLLASVHQLVETVFGQAFMAQDRVIDLARITETEVEDLAVEQGKEVTPIAIGSAEGFDQAEKSLVSATNSGRWVLLKNVHLAPSWLGQIEKRLHSLKPHPSFRLFLTAEINPKLRSSILRTCRVVVFEPATGLKANLLLSLTSIPAARLSKAPAEQSRLYPLFRFFEREVNLGASLLVDMRQDLQEILDICRGEKKQTDESRALAASLQRGQEVALGTRLPLYLYGDRRHLDVSACFKASNEAAKRRFRALAEKGAAIFSSCAYENQLDLEAQITIRFVGEDGSELGDGGIVLPSGVSVGILQQLCNTLLESGDDPVPISFFTEEGHEIRDTVNGSQDTIDQEKTLTLVYAPQTVFRVRASTRCSSSMPGHGKPVVSAQFSPDSR